MRACVCACVLLFVFIFQANLKTNKKSISNPTDQMFSLRVKLFLSFFKQWSPFRSAKFSGMFNQSLNASLCSSRIYRKEKTEYAVQGRLRLKMN